MTFEERIKRIKKDNEAAKKKTEYEEQAFYVTQEDNNIYLKIKEI